MDKDLTFLKTVIDADYKRHIKRFKQLETGKPIVFLGDSMIAYFPLKKLGLVNEVYNQGIPGDTTTGVLNRLEYVIRLRPKKIVLNVGLNDYMFTNHDSVDVYNNILKIAKKLHDGIDDLKLYIVNMTPINISRFPDQIFVKYRGLYDTDDLNDMLLECKQLTVINLYEQLVDSHHELIFELTKDGIHLNDDGYKIYLEILQKNLVI